MTASNTLNLLFFCSGASSRVKRRCQIFIKSDASNAFLACTCLKLSSQKAASSRSCTYFFIQKASICEHTSCLIQNLARNACHLNHCRRPRVVFTSSNIFLRFPIIIFSSDVCHNLQFGPLGTLKLYS